MTKTILLSVVALGFLNSSSHAATITLSGPSVVAGPTFDLDLNATNVFAGRPGDAVNGFGFNVTINSGLFTFTGATVNSVYFDDISGCCVGTAVVATTNATYFAGIGAGDFVEPLLLATLHFSVNGTGTATATAVADILDPNQGLVFLADNEPFSSPFTVTAGVPEPASIATACLGLTGLLLLRKAAAYFSSR